MKVKKVATYSSEEKKVRLVRISWNRNYPAGYRKCLSINLRPKLFQAWKEFGHVFVTVLGIQFHYKWDVNGSIPD